jgi:hypothetical protein
VNCKDCKHWGTGKRQREWDEVHDWQDEDDLKVMQARTQKICARIVLCGEAMREAVPAIAYTLDGSDYQADLWAAPTFGCVLFETAEVAREGGK